MLAIPWLILEMTGSALSMTIMMAVELVPYILLGPFLGSLIDRINRKTVIIASNIMQFLLVLSIPIASYFFTIGSLYLYVIGFVLAIFALCYDIVSDFGIIPKLVNKDNLTAANSLYQGMSKITDIGGPAIAGTLIAVLGANNALIVDGVSYLFTLAVLIILPVNLNSTPAQVAEGAEDTEEQETTSFIREMVKDVKEGFLFILKRNILWGAAFAGALMNLGLGASYPIITYYLGSEQGLPSSTVGVFFGVAGVFAIIGASLASYLSKKLEMGLAIFYVIIFTTIAAFGMYLFTQNWILVMVTYASLNAGMTIFNIYTFTLRQKEIPEEMIGRVNSAYRVILTVPFPLSALGLGWLAEQYSVSLVFLIIGICMVFSTLFILVSKISAYKESKSAQFAS